MLINTLILCLSNILPFFYCASLLFFWLALSDQQNKKFASDLARAFILGLFIALFVWFIGLPLSQLFDNTGYESLNLVLNLATWLCFIILIISHHYGHRLTFALTILIALSFAIHANGFFTYLSIYWQQEEYLPTLLAGSVLGLSVCVSICIVLFFVFNFYLYAVRQHYLIGLLSLHLGSQLSHAYVQLSHVNLSLAASSLEQLAWDSTSLISDKSITGGFLASIIGYESKPSLLYVSLYLLFSLIPLSVFYFLSLKNRQIKNTHNIQAKLNTQGESK